MSLLFLCPTKDPAPWLAGIKAVDPDIDVQVWPDISHPDDVSFALLWQHPHDVFTRFKNLKAIASLGAGIDHILQDPTIPRHLPVARIVDPNLVASMTQYVVTAVLHSFRDFDLYKQQQTTQTWRPAAPRNIADFPVGIMGMGMLGSDAAQALAALGFTVYGWRRSGPAHPALEASFAGEAMLPAFLEKTRILVCLLPLTTATRGILNTDVFSRLQPNAYLINVARGAHVVDSDLLEALGNGSLQGACLDVFNEEPLPADHPFWRHPQITVTPHVASITNPQTAAVQVVENYHRANAGQPLLHAVDLGREY
ncbi:MAG: glyoxylate/hydroxypyruvate reductase A [Bacteroidota bacterium]